MTTTAAKTALAREDHKDVIALLSNPDMPKDEKLKLIDEHRGELSQAREELEVERSRLTKEISLASEFVDGLERCRQWLHLTPVLNANDCSRLHKLSAACAAGLVAGKNEPCLQLDAKVLFDYAQSFVIQHDWAAAFSGATDYVEGAFKLPYKQCAFEFRITGRAVIVIAIQDDTMEELNQTDGMIAAFFAQIDKDHWYFSGEEARDDPFGQFAWNQIRAISIALDAEVATREIVRAPSALNKQRAKDGKEPLHDYHVVKLNGRHRKQKFNGGGTHASPRLHFRRGHWRHYESHKSWIKWTLVGNPELGFIEKHYRL